MSYPDDRYVESDDATRAVHDELGADSVSKPAALIVLLILLSIGFLFIQPWVSLIIVPFILLGLIRCIQRFNASSLDLKVRCPDCGRMLEREEHGCREYFVCHDCHSYGRGRAFD